MGCIAVLILVGHHIHPVHEERARHLELHPIIYPRHTHKFYLLPVTVVVLDHVGAVLAHGALIVGQESDGDGLVIEQCHIAGSAHALEVLALKLRPDAHRHLGASLMLLHIYLLKGISAHGYDEDGIIVVIVIIQRRYGIESVSHAHSPAADVLGRGLCGSSLTAEIGKAQVAVILRAEHLQPSIILAVEGSIGAETGPLLLKHVGVIAIGLQIEAAYILGARLQALDHKPLGYRDGLDFSPGVGLELANSVQALGCDGAAHLGHTHAIDEVAHLAYACGQEFSEEVHRA